MDICIFGHLISVKMLATNMRVAATVQVRCNFCFNWISGQHLIKKAFNSCQQCLPTVLNGLEVHTQNGEIIKLSQQKDGKGDNCSKSFIDCLSQLRSQHQHSQLGCQVEVIEEGQNTEEEQQVLSPACNRLNIRNGLDFAKKYNSTSQFLPSSQDFALNKPHQSCIFDNSKQLSAAKSVRRLANLQDYGRSLDKTRFLQRYQYYYDNDALKSYTQEHPKIEREFGDQLINIPQFNLHSYTRKTLEKSKTSRSNISSEVSTRNHKLGDEELRMRIEAALDGKYHSETLQRIMAGKVKEAYEETILQLRTLQLISYKMEEVDLICFLSLFDFQQIVTIKLVNVSLTDSQIPLLLDFIANKNIETLVLTGNKLTDSTLNLFLGRQLPHLKELYLGKNPINKYRMKENISELKTKFVLYL